MSTRSNVIFSPSDKEKLSTNHSVVVYIHHDGYISYRLVELLEFIQAEGLNYGDIPYYSRSFVKWYPNDSMGIETQMDYDSYKEYCNNYIEYIYKITPNYIYIYDDLFTLFYKIKLSDDSLGQRNILSNYPIEIKKTINYTTLRNMEDAMCKLRGSKNFEPIEIDVRELFEE